MAGTNFSRRSFLVNSIAGSVAALTLGGGVFRSVLGETLKLQPVQLRYGQGGRFKNNLQIPPLFCTAYITPDAPGQGGQEAMVARYPLALVPQDARYPFKKWRDKVKSLNPNILLFGYQMVIEETMVPGPGHDRLRKIQDAWCVYPDGSIPTVEALPWRMRIFDPRNEDWKLNFLEGCRAMMSSYPYDGIYLDQCTVYQIAHPITRVREEMKVALQGTILELRKEFPDILIIGNSRFNWAGLNGEMVENRLADIEKELKPMGGHKFPRVELVQTLLHDINDIATVKREMALAHANGGFYGACVNYQHVVWFKEFDEIIAAFHSN